MENNNMRRSRANQTRARQLHQNLFAQQFVIACGALLLLMCLFAFLNPISQSPVNGRMEEPKIEQKETGRGESSSKESESR